MAKALQHFRHLPQARDDLGVGIRRAAPAPSGKADAQLAGFAPDRVEIGNAWRTHMDEGTAVGYACQVLPHRSGIAHGAADHALDADPRAIFVPNERLWHPSARSLQANEATERRRIPG